MAGALMQLVAMGAQNQFLNGGPTDSDSPVTFFQVLYAKHTNFAVESVEQTLDGSTALGQRVTCNVSRTGDLINNVWIDASLNCSDPVNRVGFALLKNVSLTIGGQTIDKQSGRWMYLWSELTHTNDQKSYLDLLVGEKGPNGSHSGTNDNAGLMIPLQFSFCRNPGLALPLVALQYHEVKFEIDIASQSDVAQDGNATLNSMKVWVDYVFLDVPERSRFASTSHEYLIETVQTQVGNISAGSSNNVRLNFNHPVKELVWVGTQSTSAGDKFTNFIDSSGTRVPNVTADQLSEMTIRLNGQDRFLPRDHRYFQAIQPHAHHTGVPDLGINSYSFALKPEEHQPSGTCNFSRIDNAELVVTTPTASETAGGKYNQIHIFALAYNVLRITSGMGGLAYSN
jgi:hypothetical protein